MTVRSSKREAVGLERTRTEAEVRKEKKNTTLLDFEMEKGPQKQLLEARKIRK